MLTFSGLTSIPPTETCIIGNNNAVLFFSSLPFLSSFLVSSLTSVASGQERNTCLIILTMITFRLWQSSPVTKDVWHPWFLSFLPSFPPSPFVCAREHHSYCHIGVQFLPFAVWSYDKRAPERKETTDSTARTALSYSLRKEEDSQKQNILNWSHVMLCEPLTK